MLLSDDSLSSALSIAFSTQNCSVRVVSFAGPAVM